MKQETDLGPVVTEHRIAADQVQKVAIVAPLSFIFFLAMLVAFYLRNSLGYFILSSGFLVVYLFTMFGFFSMKKKVFRFHQNGISFKKMRLPFELISKVHLDSRVGLVIDSSEGRLIVPQSISGLTQIATELDRRIGR